MMCSVYRMDYFYHYFVVLALACDYIGFRNDRASNGGYEKLLSV